MNIFKHDVNGKHFRSIYLLPLVKTHATALLLVNLEFTEFIWLSSAIWCVCVCVFVYVRYIVYESERNGDG